jgi:16S rRNA (cytosine1402-N4)-methyltransferase
MTAAQRLAEVDRGELIGMLQENADEPYAEEIARQLIADRKKGKSPETTKELYEAVAAALAKVKLPAEVLERTGCSSKKQEAARRELVKKSATRVFQALRIDINREYEVLYEFMEKLPYALAPGGRAAILTFHSGEDRIVKKAFKAFRQQGIYSEVADEVIRPGREECRANPRAHSTKLRWAVRAAT